MKFLIVSSNGGEKIKCNVKDTYRYLDLEEAISEWNKFNRERRWRHSYLIVDFEKFTKDDVKSVLRCTEDDPMLPYLIIGEYHYSYADPDYSIRKDKLIIRNGGLDLEYDNNLDAMRAYLGLLRKEPKLELYIEYIVERFGKTGIKTQLVTTYKDDMNKESLRRFEIEPFTWEPAPLTAKKLYLFKLENKKMVNALYSLTEDTEEELQLIPI